MKKLAKLAGTLPFAHLLGVKAAADPEEAKAQADAKKCDDDPDAEASAQAEDDEDKKPKDTGNEEDDKGAKGSKKAKSEDDKEEPDDDDTDDKDGKPGASVAQAERARCALILAHGIKIGAVKQACAYAFDTSMSVSVAIATLDATADERRGAGGSLASRMRDEAPKTVRAEGGQQPAEGTADATVQMILAAGKKARGEA